MNVTAASSTERDHILSETEGLFARRDLEASCDAEQSDRLSR